MAKKKKREKKEGKVVFQNTVEGLNSNTAEIVGETSYEEVFGEIENSNDEVVSVCLDEIGTSKEVVSTAEETVENIAEEPPLPERGSIDVIDDCEHEFVFSNKTITRRNDKGIPHAYKVFTCKKCGYEDRVEVF